MGKEKVMKVSEEKSKHLDKDSESQTTKSSDITDELNESLLEDNPVLDPKSSISLDCDDILNFDFDDLNDLDSFLDKHTSVDKNKVKTSPLVSPVLPTKKDDSKKKLEPPKTVEQPEKSAVKEENKIAEKVAIETKKSHRKHEVITSNDVNKG